MEDKTNIEQALSAPQINLRSDEVQEIMSSVPNWMIRWGITLIFMLIVMVLGISYIIKYPDVIAGNVKIITSQPVVKLVSKNNAELNVIHFKDGEKIAKNQVVCVLNNLISEEVRNNLDLELTRLSEAIENDELLVFEFSENETLGTWQNTYSSLTKTVFDYKTLFKFDNTEFKIKNLKEQIKNHTILRSVTYNQLNTSKKMYNNAEDKFESSKKLYNQGVTSKNQYYEEEKTLINAKNEVENLKKSSIQHSITLTDLEKQLNEMSFQFEKSKAQLLQNIQRDIALLRSEISNWDLNYTLIAPINGEVSYLSSLNENQFIEAGKPLFAIIPDNQNYIGEIEIPKVGYGKVKVGQKVRLKLDNFPFHEYGQVNAVVTHISLIPNEENYLVKIKLPDGLTSSYKKELKFTPEMAGSAEIITEDLRLIERVFNQFRQIFKD